MAISLLASNFLCKLGNVFPSLNPWIESKLPHNTCQSEYKLNTRTQTPLQKLEKQGSPLDNNGVEGAQGGAVYKGYALENDGKWRNWYAEKSKNLPDTKDVKEVRKALKTATRSKLTPLGKGLSIMADQNKARQARLQNLATKTGQEALNSARKTSPAWNKVGTASKFVGRGLLVVGVGISAYNIATAPEGQRAKVVVEEASTWGGALAGGAGGAKIGAVVGSFIAPGIGTAIGAAVGGIAGGIGGAIAGSSIGKTIAGWF